MMSKDLNKMLMSPSKGVGEARGVLAKLYRQILIDLNITPMPFQQLMVKYLNDPRNGVAGDGKSRSSERGNLIKDIRRPDMSWKVFLKCIKFLDPLEIQFEVKLRWKNKQITIHGITIRFADIDAEQNIGGADND